MREQHHLEGKSPLLGDLSDESQLRRDKAWSRTCGTAVVCAALASAVLILSVTRVVTFPGLTSGGKDWVLHEQSLLATIDRSVHIQQFPGFSYNATLYTQHPSDGPVDARWSALGIDLGRFALPYKEGMDFGFDPVVNVRVRKDLSEDQPFLATLDVLHQIHCLNALRQALWYNRDWYIENQAEKQTFKEIDIAHANHCVEMLLNVIMCNDEITPLPNVWVNEGGKQLTDFGRKHQCYDFDKTKQWAEEHEVPVEWMAPFPLPEGAALTIFPGQHEMMKKLHGDAVGHHH